VVVKRLGDTESDVSTRRFGLSKFESLVDSRTRNDSSNLIKTPEYTLDYNVRLFERGLSDANPTATELRRTRLTIENVSDSTSVSINGPPVEDFGPRPYAKVWLRETVDRQFRVVTDEKKQTRKKTFVDSFK